MNSCAKKELETNTDYFKTFSLKIHSAQPTSVPSTSLSEAYSADLEGMFEGLDFSEPTKGPGVVPRIIKKLRRLFRPSAKFDFRQWRALEYRNELATREGERMKHCPIHFFF